MFVDGDISLMIYKNQLNACYEFKKSCGAINSDEL